MAKKKPRAKRRARGTGSIFPDNRRGGFVAKVPVGKYPNGKTRYAQVSGATQGEVVAKMKAVEPLDPNTVTVGEWAARWIASLAGRRPGTRAAYSHSVAGRVVAALGHVRLKDLTVSQVRAAAAQWIGPKRQGKLAPQTANTTLDRAATMFAAAVTDRLVADNPFALCPRFEFHRKPIDPFSPAELRQILEARDRLSCAPLFAFLASTGCRVGEAVALDVSDYDRATGRIAITKTYSPAHGTGPPKSKHSRRSLDLPPQARELVETAIGLRRSGPLFATASNRRFNYSDLRHRFGRLLELLGLRRRTLHALRHGFATALVARGVPIGDVAKWLGDTVAQVVRAYLHPSNFDVSATVAAILS